jgi:hypothetical protein
MASGITDRLMRDLPPPTGLSKMKDEPDGDEEGGESDNDGDEGGDAALESAASDAMAAFHSKDVGALKDALHDFVKACMDESEPDGDEGGKGY